MCKCVGMFLKVWYISHNIEMTDIVCTTILSAIFADNDVEKPNILLITHDRRGVTNLTNTTPKGQWCEKHFNFMTSSWFYRIPLVTHWWSNHQQLKVFSMASSSKHRRKHRSSTLPTHLEGNPPLTGEFLSQTASNVETVSMPLRHHILREFNVWSKSYLCRWFAACNTMRLILDTSTVNITDTVNSLRPSDAYMRHLTNPSLVQIMACRLTGAKALSEPMVE